MDFLLFLIIFFFGFVIGEMVTMIRLRNTLNRISKDLGLVLSEKPDGLTMEKPFRLITERTGDVLYLYDKETDKFICQASTVEELAILAKKYQNIQRGTIIHDNKVFLLSDGTITELKSNEN